jgi:hypothetical protein
MTITEGRRSEYGNNVIFYNFQVLALWVGPLAEAKGAYDHKEHKFEWVHDWVQWIVVDHDNQPHCCNNHQPQDKSRAKFYQTLGDIISVTPGGFTSLMLVLDQFYLSHQNNQPSCYKFSFCGDHSKHIHDNQPLLLSEKILKLVAMLPIS